MKSNKIPTRELIRLAFIWAEQDRDALAECFNPGTKERAEHRAEAAQLLAYRQKRFGRTVSDDIDTLPPISIQELRRRATP